MDKSIARLTKLIKGDPNKSMSEKGAIKSDTTEIITRGASMNNYTPTIEQPRRNGKPLRNI